MSEIENAPPAKPTIVESVTFLKAYTSLIRLRQENTHFPALLGTVLNRVAETHRAELGVGLGLVFPSNFPVNNAPRFVDQSSTETPYGYWPSNGHPYPPGYHGERHTKSATFNPPRPMWGEPVIFPKTDEMLAEYAKNLEAQLEAVVTLRSLQLEDYSATLPPAMNDVRRAQLTGRLAALDADSAQCRSELEQLGDPSPRVE